MVDFFQLIGGQVLAFIGIALAIGLCCIGSAKGTGIAVSYTQLDVYKRQVLLYLPPA